jgi:hypothetical protein
MKKSHSALSSLKLRTAITVVLAMECCLFAHAVLADTCYKDENGRITSRRRPGSEEVPCPGAEPAKPTTAPATATPLPPRQLPGATDDASNQRRQNPNALKRNERAAPASVSPIPRPGSNDYVDSVPFPDRWHIVNALGYQEHWYDPYNRNALKADRPFHDDWFFNLGVISDTTFESHQTPTPVGSSSTSNAGSIDAFGRDRQSILVENLATEFVLYKGDTVYKPPELEIRFTPAFNYNHVKLQEIQGVNANPEKGTSRNDNHVGIQAAFVDKHLRNVSDRYDFDSLRVGIQPFSSDFRGFLFQDNQLGVRLFGTRANNRYQYNIAWFRRIEKDTNSGLNDLSKPLRKDDVIAFNVYRQDTFVPGFTSQFTAIYNRNRENDETYYDNNDFQQRPAALGREAPRKYDVVYLGYNNDGHIGRLNLTSSLYYALGKEKPGVFVNTDSTISAFFAAAELSMDFNWIRTRGSVLYASGDHNPYDNKSTGFDAILENPQFAGADTSYWIRQAVPLVGGGGVTLATRNGVLNDLRSSKDEGQSNFTNPGAVLAGVGADMDVLPTLRVTANANTLYFENTKVLEVARNQGNIDKHIGYDVSASLIWRPMMSQNIVIRGAYAKLFAGKGYKELFPNSNPNYFLLNVVLAY